MRPASSMCLRRVCSSGARRSLPDATPHQYENGQSATRGGQQRRVRTDSGTRAGPATAGTIRPSPRSPHGAGAGAGDPPADSRVPAASMPQDRALKSRYSPTALDVLRDAVDAASWLRELEHRGTTFSAWRTSRVGSASNDFESRNARSSAASTSSNGSPWPGITIRIGSRESDSIVARVAGNAGGFICGGMTTAEAVRPQRIPGDQQAVLRVEEAQRTDVVARCCNRVPLRIPPAIGLARTQISPTLKRFRPTGRRNRAAAICSSTPQSRRFASGTAIGQPIRGRSSHCRRCGRYTGNAC